MLIRCIQFQDFEPLAQLAKSIWYEFYASIISFEQIQYMLRNKYTESDLSPYVNAVDRGIELLTVDDELVGFIRYSYLHDIETKLHEIYLRRSHRGMNLGQTLLARVDAVAKHHHSKSISMYVNRNNASAIRAYIRSGYVVVSAHDFDIGEGYFMNDFLMRKEL